MSTKTRNHKLKLEIFGFNTHLQVCAHYLLDIRAFLMGSSGTGNSKIRNGGTGRESQLHLKPPRCSERATCLLLPTAFVSNVKEALNSTDGCDFQSELIQDKAGLWEGGTCRHCQATGAGNQHFTHLQNEIRLLHANLKTTTEKVAGRKQQHVCPAAASHAAWGGRICEAAAGPLQTEPRVTHRPPCTASARPPAKWLQKSR